MTSLPEIATLAEVAEYLRIDERRLRALVNSNEIGHMKLGRTITFPRSAVEEYVAKHTTPARPSNPWGLTDRSFKRRQRGG